MTDLEMDLMLARAEIDTLKRKLAEQGKCCFPGGVTVKPDGINELDACDYETFEVHRNVTVEVLRCKRCGHVEILWHRQDDTEDEAAVEP